MAMGALPDSRIAPFEWLTSVESLETFLCAALPPVDCEKQRAVLHIGCGSSVLGEVLLEDPSRRGYNVSHVVNIDRDGETLQRMKERWKRRRKSTKGALHFVQLDFCLHKIGYTSGSFDLVVDKSTLDCTLCSDKSAASLLVEVYRLLNPSEGVYLVVSFHHVNYLRPLLEGLPGVNWDVQQSVLSRHTEDLSSILKDGPTTGNQLRTNRTNFIPENQHGRSACEQPNTDTPTVWSNGSFQPDEVYRQTVNVFLCRRRGCQDNSPAELDRTAVYRHIVRVNDDWYRSQNPMLTHKRKEAIHTAMADNDLSLQQAYLILFTEEEREHLTYDHFLEDWEAYRERHPDVPSVTLSKDTAFAFMDEMQ